MLRKKVLGIGTNSATLLVQDTEANNALRVLRRVNVGDLGDEVIRDTQRFYDTLLTGSPSMPAMVEVHTVLLQNAFLNVITSFGAGGDLSTFLDDDLSGPLPEKIALQWLLVMTHAVKQLRDTTGLPYYGLSLDRVFLTQKVSGEASTLPDTVVVGLPLPPDVFENTLKERMQQGIALEREYPPEIVASKGHKSGYDVNVTDVWVLGSIGIRLLSANSQIASRSSRTRELLTRMTANQPRDRLSVDQVISTLTSLAGPVSLPPRERSAATKANNTASRSTEAKNANVASDAPALPRAGHRHRNTPQQRVQTPVRDGGKPAGWQQKAQEQFDVLRRMNSGTQISPAPRTNSRGSARDGSPQRQQIPSKQVGVTGAGSRPGSAQRLQRSGSSNSALRTSGEKGVKASSPVVGSGGGDAPSSRSGTPNNAKIRDLLTEQQENLRLRRERLRQEREQQRKQRGASDVTQSGDGSEGTPSPEADAEKEEAGEVPTNIRRHLQEWRQKMAADATETERDGVLVFTPPPSSVEVDAASSNDKAKPQQTRKNASPAVRRQAGSPRGSGDQNASPRFGTPDGHSFANLKGNQAPIHYTRQKEIPITVAVPKGFEENEESEGGGGRERRGEMGSPRGAGARRRPASRSGRREWIGTATPESSTASQTPSDATPQRDVPRPASRSGGGEAPRSGAVTPPREPPTRTADLAAAARPQVPQHRAHVDPAQTSLDGSNAGDAGSPGAAAGRSPSSDRATQLSLQCAIDALRTSIRNLCRDRTRYGEAMVITSEFARQSEPIRTAPRANEEFMRRLKEGIADNRLFAAAAPLCAQLVALEGLEQSIFDAQRAQQRGGR